MANKHDQTRDSEGAYGRVTRSFLFTDIEGSTPLWEEDATAMATALARHDRLIGDAVEACGGTIVKHLGDGFAATFEAPGKAMAAAVDIQRAIDAEPWPASTVLRVRAGLHLGEADSRGGDYFGRTVNLAARIMGEAAGGQILASATFVNAVASMHPGITTRDEGKCALKGIREPVELMTLAVEGLAPPPVVQASPHQTSHLPVAPNELVGRQNELAAIAADLEKHRLITLVGPPGTGKTRLAIEAAGAAEASFPLGAHLVELAGVSDPTQLGDAVADLVLGIDAIATPGSAIERLGNRLSKPALIVLDNCEHLLDGVRDLAARLLQAIPELRLIATSRELLFIGGEHPIEVEPLATDVAGPAVQLFLQRARHVRPGFSESDENALAAFCERLDGLPLAIELAAARLDVLSFSELDSRLDRVLRSSRRRRGFSDRHATLDTAVQWSWDLLDDDERLVLARASVFVGSFDLDAATTVCCGDDFDVIEIIDLIGSLQDRSFISSVFDETSTRFRLLSAVRVFAGNQLGEQETAETRRRHQNHYIEASQQLATAFDEKPDLALIAQLELDDPNFTAALLLTGDAAEVRGARKLAMSLHTYWEETGRLTQGYHHAKRLVDPHDSESSLWRAVLGLSVSYAAMTGNLDAAREGEVLLGELIGGPTNIRALNAYFALGFAALGHGDMVNASEWFDRAAEAVAPFDGGGERQALVTAGACLAYSGDPAAALDRYRQAHDAALPEPGWFQDYATVFECSAQLQANPTGDVTDQCDAIEAALASLMQRGLGFRVTVAAHQASLAFALTEQWDRLDQWWPVTLKTGRANGHLWAAGLAIELAAWSAANAGAPEAAVEHWSIVDATFTGAGYGMPATHQAIRAKLQQPVLDQLGTTSASEIAARQLHTTLATWADQQLPG